VARVVDLASRVLNAVLPGCVTLLVTFTSCDSVTSFEPVSRTA